MKAWYSRARSSLRCAIKSSRLDVLVVLVARLRELGMGDRSSGTLVGAQGQEPCATGGNAPNGRVVASRPPNAVALAVIASENRRERATAMRSDRARPRSRSAGGSI